MEDKLLSIAQVVAYLNIPKSTIYKLSQRGDIPTLKIGRQLRYKKSSLDNWLSSRESGTLIADTTCAKCKNPKNILLVDDDKLVLRAINNFLSFEGHSVTSVDTGEEALRQIKDKEYDLLIIDVRMPGLNGIDTIKTIREYLKKQKKPAIPEIVITGYMDSAAENDAGKLGIKEFIYKPFSIKDFKSVIDKKITKVSNKKVS